MRLSSHKRSRKHPATRANRIIRILRRWRYEEDLRRRRREREADEARAFADSITWTITEESPGLSRVTYTRKASGC